MSTPDSNNAKVEGNKKVTPAPAATTKAAETTTTKAEAPPKPKLEASGRYGIDGNMIDMASIKPGNKLTNKMAGSDPAPGKLKFAIIDYSWNTGDVKGKTQQVRVNEGEKIVLPQ